MGARLHGQLASRHAPHSFFGPCPSDKHSEWSSISSTYGLLYIVHACVYCNISNEIILHHIWCKSAYSRDVQHIFTRLYSHLTIHACINDTYMACPLKSTLTTLYYSYVLEFWHVAISVHFSIISFFRLDLGGKCFLVWKSGTILLLMKHRYKYPLILDWSKQQWPGSTP